MMVRQQPRDQGRAKRGVLARPLDALVFLLPLIIFSEVISATRGHRVLAFDLLRHFFELFGRAGTWTPACAVVVILLATHFVSRQKWSIRWKTAGLMYVEAAALALPLLLFNRMIPLTASTIDRLPLLDQVALSIGAGIYEELVFRLMAVSLMVMVGVDLLRRDPAVVAVVAVLVSSLVFAAYHHRPIGQEPFTVTSFLFRVLAGAYLAVIFWYRGYGPAAGCHAAYNLLLTLLAATDR